MASGPMTIYPSVVQYIGDGTLDLDAAGLTATLALFQSTSNFATTTLTKYGDLTNEVSNANGYTTGGVALGSVTFTRVTATATFTSAAASWTASGSGIVARAGVLYANATLNGIVKPLLAYYLFDATPADVTALAGQPFIAAPAATGWFTITKSP